MPRRQSTQTLDDFIDEWWRRRHKGWRASTREQRADLLERWIRPQLGRERLCDLTLARLEDWKADIMAEPDDSLIGPKPCTPGQFNKAASILSACLGRAVKWGQLAANPVVALTREEELVSRPKALTPDEIEAIRQQLPTLRDVAFWSLLSLAGLRPSEAVALTWGSVGPGGLNIDRSFASGALSNTKTRRRRIVDLIQPLAEDLFLAAPVDWPGSDALIAPNTEGGHLDYRVWRRRVWKPAIERARVEASPYDGRHSFVSLRLHEHRAQGWVAEQGGHSAQVMNDR